MINGEAWIAHPFFSWLMVILSWWVALSTVVQIRNWVRIRRLERSLARRVRDQSVNHNKEQYETEEQPAPAIENELVHCRESESDRI